MKKFKSNTPILNYIYLFFRMTFLENSPWLVNTLEEFLYYCCPECDQRDHSKDSFIHHAYEHHPEAKEALAMVIGVKIELPEVKLEDVENSNDDEPLDAKKKKTKEKVQRNSLK